MAFLGFCHSASVRIGGILHIRHFISIRRIGVGGQTPRNNPMILIGDFRDAILGFVLDSWLIMKLDGTVSSGYWTGTSLTAGQEQRLFLHAL